VSSGPHTGTRAPGGGEEANNKEVGHLKRWMRFRRGEPLSGRLKYSRKRHQRKGICWCNLAVSEGKKRGAEGKNVDRKSKGPEEDEATNSLFYWRQ